MPEKIPVACVSLTVTLNRGAVMNYPPRLRRALASLARREGVHQHVSEAEARAILKLPPLPRDRKKARQFLFAGNDAPRSN